MLVTLNAGITVNNGVLQAVFDHSAIKEAYLFSSKPAYDVCLPRDICQIDTSTSSSCTIQAQASFLDGNPTDYADYQTAVTSICTYWATATSGRTSEPNTPGDDAGDPIFADCPAGGCLGYMFTLPADFTAKPYAQVGASLTGCFDVTWNIPMSNIDPACPTPSTPNPTAFCPAGITPTPTPGTPGPAQTATTGAPPTSTATRADGATLTPTTGTTAMPTTAGATATPTVPTPTRTATPAPRTVTPTPTAAVPESTATSTPVTTPTGPLVWALNETTMATLTGIPTAGQGYSQGQLEIRDADTRFCTSDGTFPQVQVKVSSTDLLTIGLFPVTSTAFVDVAVLPAAPAGTYDVRIQTFPGCDGTKAPTELTMPSAIVYE